MKIRLMVILFAMCASLGFSMNSFEWGRISQGIYESEVQTLLIDPKNDKNIYAGTSKGLYRSIDQGRNYRMILRLSGDAKKVNDIYIPERTPEAIYVATDGGLFESLDSGKTWERIYFSSDAQLRQCFAVLRDNDAIYLGTKKGLLFRTGTKKQWDQIKQNVDDEAVYHIVGDSDELYISTDRGVFSLEKRTRIVKRVYSLGIGIRQDNDVLSDQDPKEDQPDIKFIAAIGAPQPVLLMASIHGIYFSLDKGKKWRSLPADGLALDDLTSILVSQNEKMGQEGCLEFNDKCFELIAGTQKGVFFFNDGKWKPIYRAMTTNKINYLTKDTRGTVYAATDKGVFYLPVGETLPFLNETQEEKPTMSMDVQTAPENWPEFDHEPSINAVHQMAIDYAEVSHKKIETWRKQARQKAWFPDLDIGVDGDRDWSSSDSIWGSYSSGGQHYVGPDDKTRGEDIGWDVSLSWDLADLVWSTDQTTIDSRSKMMVELREDILNEVTRLYFERRRNQIELACNRVADWQSRIEKEMRIEELTALIDALTGGKFSRAIERQRSKKQEAEK